MAAEEGASEPKEVVVLLSGVPGVPWGGEGGSESLGLEAGKRAIKAWLSVLQGQNHYLLVSKVRFSRPIWLCRPIQ